MHIVVNTLSKLNVKSSCHPLFHDVKLIQFIYLRAGTCYSHRGTSSWWSSSYILISVRLQPVDNFHIVNSFALNDNLYLFGGFMVLIIMHIASGRAVPTLSSLASDETFPDATNKIIRDFRLHTISSDATSGTQFSCVTENQLAPKQKKGNGLSDENLCLLFASRGNGGRIWHFLKLSNPASFCQFHFLMTFCLVNV